MRTTKKRNSWDKMRGAVSFPLIMPRLRQRKILGFATCLMSIVDQISCMEGAWRTMHMRKYSKKFHLVSQKMSESQRMGALALGT